MWYFIYVSDTNFCFFNSLQSHVQDPTHESLHYLGHKIYTWHSQIHPRDAAETSRSLLSSPFASAPEVAAEDTSAAANRMDIEAAEILVALSHSKKRDSVTVSSKFGAKRRCKGRRVKKRAGCSSNESLPSDIGSNPVHSDSDLAERTTTKKKLNLKPLPSYKIGLTQEEIQEKNIKGAANQKEDNENRVDIKEKQKSVKKESIGDTRMRHKMSIPKVYELIESIEKKKRKSEIIEELKETGFGGMLHICNWTKIHSFFIDFVIKNFDKENLCIRLSKPKVLELKEEDVHRVYELPRAGKKINISLSSEAAIIKLRKELGLKGSYSQFVKLTDFEIIMKKIEDPKVWVKGAILFIIHNMLCPTNRNSVSLQYAHILNDIGAISSYNWCSYILEYMREGIKTPEVTNPLADFHFLLINYIEKMGKESSFLTGKYKKPSLRDWDVKITNQNLQKIHETMGLEHGLTAGITTLRRLDEFPTVLWFDADTCPLFTVNMHSEHCRQRIKIYTRSLETLERRLAEQIKATKVDKEETTKKHKTEEEKTKTPKTMINHDESNVGERTQNVRQNRLRTIADEAL